MVHPERLYARGDRVGGYHLRECIGRGGFGEVWRASDTGAEETKDVAVKIITDPGMSKRLRSGETPPMELEHRHIVTYHQLQTRETPPYIVMELIKGGSLRDMMNRVGRIPWDTTMKVMNQILSGVEHAHAADVVHGDLKPSNILIEKPEKESGPITPAEFHRSGGHVKISDFGIGGREEERRSVLLKSGKARSRPGLMNAGTFHYMAPEQKSGGSVTVQTDVFACGKMFYELMTGRKAEGAYPPAGQKNGSVPVSADAVVWKALQPKSENRYEQISEMKADLRRIQENEDPLVLNEYRKRRTEPVHGTPDVARMPIQLPTGEKVYSLDELLDAVSRNPDPVGRELIEGNLENWLRRNRRKKLSRVARDLRRSESRPGVALQKFLERTGLQSPPELKIEQNRIDLGELYRGVEEEIRLFMTSQGPGILHGSCHVEPDVPWILPREQTFSGSECSVSFFVRTDNMEPGETKIASLKVETNGGDRGIPVRFTISRRPPVPGFSPEEQDVVLRRFGGTTVKAQVENDGEEAFTGRLSARQDWLLPEETGEMNIAPGEEKAVTIQIDKSKLRENATFQAIVGGGRRTSGWIDLKGEDTAASHHIRVYEPGRPNYTAFLGGLFLGIVPILAELFMLMVLFNSLSRGLEEPMSTEDQMNARNMIRENILWMAGLAPGIVWHLYLIL